MHTPHMECHELRTLQLMTLHVCSVQKPDSEVTGATATIKNVVPCCFTVCKRPARCNAEYDNLGSVLLLGDGHGDWDMTTGMHKQGLVVCMKDRMSYEETAQLTDHAAEGATRMAARRCHAATTVAEERLLDITHASSVLREDPRPPGSASDKSYYKCHDFCVGFWMILNYRGTRQGATWEMRLGTCVWLVLAAQELYDTIEAEYVAKDPKVTMSEWDEWWYGSASASGKHGAASVAASADARVTAAMASIVGDASASGRQTSVTAKAGATLPLAEHSAAAESSVQQQAAVMAMSSVQHQAAWVAMALAIYVHKFEDRCFACKRPMSQTVVKKTKAIAISPGVAKRLVTMVTASLALMGKAKAEEGGKTSSSASSTFDFSEWCFVAMILYGMIRLVCDILSRSRLGDKDAEASPLEAPLNPKEHKCEQSVGIQTDDEFAIPVSTTIRRKPKPIDNIWMARHGQVFHTKRCIICDEQAFSQYGLCTACATCS